MKKKPELTELVDLKLPPELVKRLCSRPLMQMLEVAWLDAFARGAEFGMALIRDAQTTIAASKKKKRKKARRRPA